MELSFREWVVEQQFDEVELFKSAEILADKFLRWIKLNYPFLINVFNTRGMPKSFQAWHRGFGHGKAAAKNGLPLEANEFENVKNNPEYIDLYNGWSDGHNSITRQKVVA